MNEHCNRRYLRDAKPCFECIQCFPGHKQFKPVSSKLSNAERIRAMSDAELAAWIIRMQSHDISLAWCSNEGCTRKLDNDDFDCTDEMLTACVIRWLRQERED